MKILAAAISLLVLLGYVALMRADPAFGFLHPRGGLAMLAVSIAIANLGIWLATQSDRPLRARFQLAVAGWIWLAVQGGSLAYLYAG